MTALVAALALSASCEHPALLPLSPERQVEACALLETRREAPPGQPDRARLMEIYSRPEFATARARDTGALKAFLAQLRTWLESFFESSGAEAYSNVTRFFVLVVGCLIAAFAAARLLARLRSGKAPTPLVASRGAPALVLDSPPVHLTRARALLASDPRGAIREGLLSLLSHLEQSRLARPDRVKTNRELAEELPSRGAAPGLVTAVSAVLGWYDVAFYSLEPVRVDDAARFLDDVTLLGGRVAGASPLPHDQERGSR